MAHLASQVLHWAVNLAHVPKLANHLFTQLRQPNKTSQRSGLSVFPRPSVLDSWPRQLQRQVHIFHYAVHSVSAPLRHNDLDS